MSGRIFVIGASLSGIDALTALVSLLPPDFADPILIAQHVASHSPGMLPYILSKAGPLPALHPKDGEAIQSGRIYVAPPDRHMLIHDGSIRLSHGPHENLARPAIDPLFRSAAAAYGPKAVGIVLTGQLNDGTAGLMAIKDCSGIAIVQQPSEATAQSMPQSALRHVTVDHCCKLADIARLMVDLALDPPSLEEALPLVRLMQIENRIAEGIFNVDDWWSLEQMSSPSGLNCPDCRSALYELNDKRMLRFRCRSGHAFTAQSLLSGQAEARETLFSTIFGCLIEEATLMKRIVKDPYISDDIALALELNTRMQSLEREAEDVCTWLHTMAGLVEPEPAQRENGESASPGVTG